MWTALTSAHFDTRGEQEHKAFSARQSYRERVEAQLGMESALFHHASVYDVHNARNGNRSLRNVGGEHNLDSHVSGEHNLDSHELRACTS